MAGKKIEFLIEEGSGGIPKTGPRISQSAGDQIEWNSKDERFTVEFADSPFAQKTFLVGKNDPKLSGKPETGTEGKSYKYTVKGPNGTLDPTIFVDP